ncbi:adenine phosphoribosyltransferase-like [Saccostrea echinata]|uniref:adenine phosphoribosyltransferase-like n=1 Tax=Saccostrea echinata TaxID=191078 RepID=UPI002A7FC578|nr:adenine phosphoribosyltransferase-like [Saccostrea echinata]XP_061197524.1 adenine phosphoribosyltransferase-like [Saccostrea echinata]
MTDNRIERIKSHITEHPDFPTPGVLFRDIFPVLRNPGAFNDLMDAMVEYVKEKAPGVEIVVGLEARGFLFGPIIAQRLNCSFAPVRKKGKLPGKMESVSYTKEYGTDVFEVQKEAFKPGQSVVIVDDLLATGGTMKAACELIEKVGAKVILCLVVIELTDLNGQGKLSQPCSSLIKY